jgi:hypothetical protein
MFSPLITSPGPSAITIAASGKPERTGGGGPTTFGLGFQPDAAYLGAMLSRSPQPSGFIEPCLPSPADRPPDGPNWVHEIKHDGYRLMARRDPIGIRLITRGGHDMSADGGQGIVPALCFNRVSLRRGNGFVGRRDAGVWCRRNTRTEAAHLRCSVTEHAPFFPSACHLGSRRSVRSRKLSPPLRTAR